MNRMEPPVAESQPNQTEQKKFKPNLTEHPNQTTAKLDERFIAKIQNKEFVVYQGVLDMAHQLGLKKLMVKTLQFPTKENGSMAICRAVAIDASGRVFSDIGDACPGNVASKIAPHILRMASTRAKGRALRDFCNIGIACLEELGEFDELSHGANGKPNGTRQNGSKNAKTNGRKSSNPSNNNPITAAQIKAIENLAQRKNIPDEELNQAIQNQFNQPLKRLTSIQASELIRTLQNK